MTKARTESSAKRAVFLLTFQQEAAVPRTAVFSKSAAGKAPLLVQKPRSRGANRAYANGPTFREAETVLGAGLEPACLSAYAPQTYVSAIPPPERFGKLEDGRWETQSRKRFCRTKV